MLCRELSDQMESFTLDQTQTFMKSVSGGEDFDFVKTPLDGSFDLWKKRDLLTSSKTIHKARFSNNFVRNSLTNPGRSQRKTDQFKFSVLEEKAMNQVQSVKQYSSNPSQNKPPSQEASPKQFEGSFVRNCFPGSGIRWNPPSGKFGSNLKRQTSQK